MTAKHEYPSSYKPNSDAWFIRASWIIMDSIKPGTLSKETRFYLAGQIAGALTEAYKIGKEHGDPGKRWPKP